MIMTEAQLRKLIRQELLKEMAGMEPKQPEPDLTPMDYLKSAGMGAGVTGVVALVNWLIWYVQTKGVGHELAMKLQELSKVVQNALEE